MKRNYHISAAILLLIMTVTFINPHLSASAADDAPGTGIIEIPEEGIRLEYTVLGGNITEATNDGWKSKYYIKGTVGPGETLSIAVSGNGTTLSQFNPVNQDLDATMSVWFDAGNGEENREILTLAPGESGSVSSSFIVPEDARTVKIFGYIGNAWINPNGGGSRDLILNVEFEVVTEEMPLIVQGQEQVPESESSESAPNPTSEGSLGRIIVIMGIAIAGTLGVIAGELASKAAQAAASENEEQPTEEPVYVLNPSHNLFNLEVNHPVTLNVNGYRVTQAGYQIENNALISISLPPNLAEYFSLQTTGSNGQVSCIITLIKIPSASNATLEVNGAFPQGIANAQVQLAFKMKFTISPVDSPKITYYEKDKQWRAPELIAAFRDTEQNTPVKVGFYYVFNDPPLKFEPDILEVKEGYSSDDGLTYNFKLKVKDDIDLETIFDKDLTKNNGKVTVSVVVKDEQGKEYAAETELQLNPQLKMIACSYNKNFNTRGLRATPYEGLELDELEFIADGIDKLPLVIFFIRSDKEVIKGSEAEAVMDIVEVQKLEWSNTASFEEPEVNKENTGKGFFAYDLSSSGLIAMDKDTVNGVYGLEVDARIRACGPKNYSFEGNSMRFLVKPQFILLRLWVVPGHTRSTSDAIAYAKLLPSHKPLTGLTLTLETSGGGGATLNTSDGSEKLTQIQDPPEGVSKWMKLTKGTARWILTYSGLTWSNLSGAQFQVICKGPGDKFGNCVTASDSFDVNANVTNMLSDLLSESDIQTKMNNPYNFKENDAIPEFLNGPIWNCFNWFDDKKPYVCGWMQLEIISYLRKRRHYNSEGDLAARLASMRGMNGIEYENYNILAVHAWAGFFLSGNSSKDFKALDPWWEQRWVDPSFNKPENLMTLDDEALNLTKMAASVGFIATIAVSYFAAVGVAVSLVAMATLIRCLLIGMTVTAALDEAGIINLFVSNAIPYGSEAIPPDQTLVGFHHLWLLEFIQCLDLQDLNKWRKA